MAFFLASALMAKAGGSVHRDDVQDLLKTNPVLASLIQKNFELGEIGDAVRLGKHMGGFGGARIGPYEFPAVVKPGGSKVVLVLNTEVVVKDAKGKVFELNQVTPQSTGLSLSETLLSYETKAEPQAAAKAASVG
ncbi:hypothetical protein N9230_01280 [Akkermansiaceae bacterium]|nr:hypothetical protein [Akkermansiaceae bacterium]